MPKTYCQKCGQKRECSLRLVDTKKLHDSKKLRDDPFKRLTGHQGKATLSVCADCAR